jgi:hypothetical protein
MTKTPWIIEFYCDHSPHKHAACFENEADAREILNTLHNHLTARCRVQDERGFEIMLYPDRYSIVLIPPETAAALEQAATQPPAVAGSTQ